MQMRVITGLLLLATWLPQSRAEDLSPSAVFDIAAPSVVVVNGLDGSGKPLLQGSGVVISPTTVVSNCHVFLDAKSAQIIYQGKTHPATLLHGDSARDLCSFTVEGLQASPARLGSTGGLKVGSQVFAIGAPRGFDLTLSDGLISSLRSVTGGPPVLQVTSPISPGSSGGGLFDSQGLLIGITTLYWKDSPQLNFAVPVEWVQQLPTRDSARRAAEPTHQDDPAHQMAVNRARESLQHWDAYMMASDPTYGAKRDALDRIVRTIRETSAPKEWLAATILAYATIQPTTGSAGSVRDRAVELRWQPIYEAAEQSGHFDRHSYSKSGNLVTAWIRTSYASPQEFAGVTGVAFYLSRERYDCGFRTSSASMVVTYSADGTILESASVGFTTPEPVIPGSFGEMTLQALCQ